MSEINTPDASAVFEAADKLYNAMYNNLVQTNTAVVAVKKPLFLRGVSVSNQRLHEASHLLVYAFSENPICKNDVYACIRGLATIVSNNDQRKVEQEYSRLCDAYRGLLSKSRYYFHEKSYEGIAEWVAEFSMYTVKYNMDFARIKGHIQVVLYDYI